MKILHTVESYSPSIGGMQEVARQLSERLVSYGHDVTVATSANKARKENSIKGVKIVEFDISGNDIRGYQGRTKQYQDFLLNCDFDIITNFAVQQWATDLALPVLDKIKAKKILVPTGFSGLYLPVFKGYYKKMKKWMKKYDLNIFLSNSYRDIDFARANNLANITVIPNGSDEMEFLAQQTNNIRTKLGISSKDFLVLLVGTHTGLKGHSEAISIFCQANIPNSCLLIVGNTLPNLTSLVCYNSCKAKAFMHNRYLPINNQILIRNFSREETVAAYQSADLFLFPSLIECSPLVLFESIASQTPFLTTEVGNSKEIIEWTKGGMLLPTTKDQNGYSHAKVKESSKMLKEIWLNKKERSKLAQNGFAVWKKRFSWDKISKQYEAAYLGLLKTSLSNKLII